MSIDTKDYVAFSGILVTFSLGLYNAVQNYRSSRRTTFINTVTSERVKWIDKLRESISTFCGTAYYWRFSTLKGSPEEKQKMALSENLTERPLLRNFLHPLNREEPTLVTAIRLAGDAEEVTGVSEMRREQGYD